MAKRARTLQIKQNKATLRLKKKLVVATDKKRRPSSYERGYDNEWRKARNEHIDKNPFCVRCGGVATLVDHIVPIHIAPERRLDKTNFQSMCIPCHKIKTDEDEVKYGQTTARYR